MPGFTVDLSDVKERNPFTKKYLNLTKQAGLLQTDPKLYEQLKATAPGIDAEEDRKKKTRSLQEFNELDTAQKVRFIQSGGEIA